MSLFGFEVGKNRIKGDFITLPDRNVTLFGVIELPITCREICGTEAVRKTQILSEAQALELAKKAAYDEMNKRISEGELLQVEITEKTDENGVTVTLFYTCIVDIAVPQTEK